MVANNDLAMDISEKEFEETISNPNGLTVVDFYAEWCMPCLMIAPVIEELAAKFTKIKFARVNIDENHSLSSKFDVSSIPCLILFKSGHEIDRIIGALPEEVIEEKIRKHIK
ncbi:thioredoxin [Candidatus Pacearchaeota archaeon RBG_13_36_9]|nr:MAG: thioredoxin [Candidatus Pacearchaeota archaeon RBG_13_36_9]